MIMKGFYLKKLFSFTLISLMTGSLFGQLRDLSGQVRDEEGRPLERVTVKSAHQSTTTSSQGTFQLEKQEVGQDVTFSAMGYLEQTLTIPAEGTMEVFMTKDQTDIEEVVVIGYGEQSRSKVTTSVSKVDAEEFDRAPGQNPLLQLQGKVAGLSLQVQDGQPGASPQIFIRGGSSTSPESDAPLFIVDGLVSQGTRSINDLNPDDIESVQVLKDAASTAIYGARAANGIVIVTTKKGKMGKPQINLRYTHGVEQQPKRLPLLNARDYVYLTRNNIAKFNTSNPEFFLEGGRYGMSTGNLRDANNTLAFLDDYINEYGQDYVDQLINQQGWETMVDPATNRQLLFQDNDYQNATFQTGGKQELDFDISGGTEKARYYFGLGYLNQDGIVRGTDYTNYSALFNGEFKLSDNWSIHTKFTYQLRKTNAPNNYEWVLSRSVLMPPTYRQYYENGLPAPGEGISSFRNRLHEMYYKTKYNDVNVHRTNMQVGANWDILPGLKFRPALYYFTSEGIENYFEAYNVTVTNRPASAAHNFDRHLQVDGLLTYDKVFGHAHDINAILGASYNNDYAYRMNGSGREALTDHIPTLNASSDITQRVSTTKTSDALLSYFTRINYAFNGKYLLSASLRADGSSRFAKDNRWGFFPGVSGGWNIHQEDFFKPLTPAFSQLKLRGSWGKTGNNALSVFDSQGRYSTGYAYMGHEGILNTALMNRNLVWEQTASFDIGVDFGLFNNRVMVLMDYYNKLTDRRLFDKPLWSQTGYNSIRSNFGSIRSRGFEVELQTTPIQKEHFQWNIDMTFSYNRSIALTLPENEEDKNRVGGNYVYDPALGDYVKVGGIAEGERYGGRWAYSYQGVYQSDEEAANAPEDPNASGRVKTAGDAIFADLDGDGILDNNDMVFMGYIRPDKMGGMVNSFRYKNFSARLVIDWATGHVIDNSFMGNVMGSTRNNNNAFQDALTESWSHEGHQATYPKYTVQSDFDYNFRNHMRWDNAIGGSGTNNSLYYGKGDYIAFREISASYRLQGVWLERAKLRGVEVFAGVYNLGYITAYKGMMPEIYDGVDYGTYPRPRHINFGLKAMF